MIKKVTSTIILAALLAGCGGATAGTTGTPSGPTPEIAVRSLPQVPTVQGDLRIDVVYPAEGAAIGAVDSTFIFGSVGHGGAALTVNGAPVDVAANGAWLAYLPLPGDGVYQLSATAAGQTVTATRTVRVSGAGTADTGELGIVEGSASLGGAGARRQGERVEVSFRGSPGGQAYLYLGDGTAVPLVERQAIDRSFGFMLNSTSANPSVSEYVGTLELRSPIIPTAGEPAVSALVNGRPSTGTTARVQLSRDGQTVSSPIETTIHLVDPLAPRVAVASTARPDGTVIGRRGTGSDQAWDFFWPNGTILAIDGESAGFYRVRLTPELSAWVTREDVTILPGGTPPPDGYVGPSMQLTPYDEWTEVRFTVSDALPFRIEPSEWGLTIEFYGATGRPAYVGYGAEDSFVRRIDWEQQTDDLFRFNVHLSRPLWGYRARWEGGALIVDVRKPPTIEFADPLRGLTIAVDAGHMGSSSDTGATGPTRLTEAESTLLVARRISEILRGRGVDVVEIRPDAGVVPLIDRPIMAERADADLFFSVHFNAFPDGVDPFANHGTTMFYFWPHSLDFGRRLQREVLSEVGLPDRGVRYQNLAITRSSWMPSVLTESLYMMFPQQEAALRDPEFIDRLAQAHVRAMDSFVRDRTALRAAPGVNGW